MAININSSGSSVAIGLIIIAIACSSLTICSYMDAYNLVGLMMLIVSVILLQVWVTAASGN